MKVKHIPYKDFVVKAKKKGKKQGRPSKQEIAISSIISDEFVKNQENINKCINDAILYGTGLLKIYKQGR